MQILIIIKLLNNIIFLNIILILNANLDKIVVY